MLICCMLTIFISNFFCNDLIIVDINLLICQKSSESIIPAAVHPMKVELY